MASLIRRRSSDISTTDGMCRVDPTTSLGRRRQVAQFVLLPLLPSVGLLAYLLVGVAGYALEYSACGRLRAEGHTVEALVGEVVLRLQEEAAGVAFYVATNGTDLLGSLSELYAKTDAALGNFRWPPGGIAHYQSQDAFHASLTRRRKQLTLGQDKVIQEVEYYQAVLSTLLDWASSSLLRRRAPLTILLALSAYTGLAWAANVVSAERLLGGLYFIQGSLPGDLLALYVQEHDLGIQTLTRVLSASGQLNASYDVMYASAHAQLSVLYDQMEAEDLLNTRRSSEYYTAVSWDRRMGYYTEIMGWIRHDLLSNISTGLDSKMAEAVQKLAYNVIVSVILLSVFTPFLIVNAKQTMENLRIYSHMMTRNNLELRREKRKADQLLKEMLPRQVAERLQRGITVNAESFTEATVFFSDIPDFPDISRKSTPLEIVSLLNELYRFMDAHLERYDVYKVETIGCVYMVVSGVPSPNSGRHVREVARLSLDLNDNMADFIVPHMREHRLYLRTGISSGPCVAGVVGLKAPRYCLFGDTVNTAARMQTNGLPNKIHLSPSTYQLLRKHSGFALEYRGQMEIKGKGKLNTYWLKSRDTTDSLHSRSSSNSTHAHSDNGVPLPGSVPNAQ